MKWRPVGQPAEKPMENEMLWTSLAQQTEETEGQTLVHCNYVSKKEYPNGGWVNIFATTFLVNADTGEHIQLAQAMNIPVAPARHFFNRPGELKQFTLLFPRVPKFWKRFHLIEEAGPDSFQVKDIDRNDQGVYRVSLT